MQRTAVQHILGLFLMVFSFTMLPPVAVGWWYQDGAVAAFLLAFVGILISGAVLWLPVRHSPKELRLREGFIIVVLFWVVLGLFGAVPFLLSEHPAMSLTDAVFESVSGLTTTGATVLTGLDALPHAILYYRQQLQWLGGMGIIVLAVAMLPMLGVGGMQLFRAETPGPMKDNKLTPRMAGTAKALWYIYLALTLACAGAYWAVGMDLFDAIAHSFSTVSIGGFSPHDQSMGYFDSAAVEAVAVVFMLLAGVNFSLHFLAWRDYSLKPYLGDAEFRTYVKILLWVAVITSVYLYLTRTFSSPGEAIQRGVFQAVSIGTTTGFTTAAYYSWPGFLPVLLLLVSFIGGSAQSTGGGMKVIRVLLLFKQGLREIMRLIHPNAQLPIKIGSTALPERVVEAVWGFFSLYVFSLCILSLVLAAFGLDLISAFSAVAACMNNLGPGLGDVGAHYGSIHPAAKWVLCFAMLLGRLEVFTLLVLLTPSFWRK